MQQISLIARAKINLGLDVTGKRDDGYHMVRMIMQTIDLHDTVLLKRTENPGIRMYCDREDLPVDESNLCVKAAKLLMEEFSLAEGVEIHLTKRIPVAAGLAGGSTDAAAVLLGMRVLFSLDLTDEQLCDYGVQIGADVPYCIIGGTMRAEGIGEILTPITPMMEVPMILVKPDIDVSTKHVYEKLDALAQPIHPDIDAIEQAIRSRDFAALQKSCGNILEGVTENDYPVITKIKGNLKDTGADVVLMSGSGPSVFGIYESKEKRDAAYETLKERLSSVFFVATSIWNPERMR